MSLSRRKWRELLVLLTMFSLLMTGTAWAEPVKVLVDGKPFTLDLPTQSGSAEALIQAQRLVEALDIQISWNLEQQAIELKRADQGSDLRISLLQWALAPRSAEEAVRAWAESILRRNGAWRYAVSSPEEREKHSFAPYWVTGVSSPWADDFEIEPIRGEPSLDSAQFLVRFFWWTSTGLSGQSEQKVIAKRNSTLLGEPWLITRLEEDPVPAAMTIQSAQPITRTTAPATGSAQPTSSPTKPVRRVPFLTTGRATGETMLLWGYSPVIKSFWNLDEGKLELSGEELFEARSEGQNPIYRLSWDGSDEIAVLPETGSKLRIFASASAKAEVDPWVVKDIGGNDLVVVSPDHEETLVARTLWEEPRRLQLEIRSTKGITAIPLSTESLKLEHTPLRPVALQWDSNLIRCYIESVRDASLGGGWGLLEATLDRSVGKGDLVAWRVVTDDLKLSEAGAGTRMVKLGDDLYIGRQEGTVTRVNLRTGEQTDCPAIKDALDLFRRRYAPVVMGGSNPPALYAYGDALIVSWGNQVARELIENGQLIDDYQPVEYVLAVGADGILGQIQRVDDRVVVYNQDNAVTHLVMLSSPDTNWGMVFPTPHN